MSFGFIAIKLCGNPVLSHRQPRFLGSHNVLYLLTVVTTDCRSCRSHAYVVTPAKKSFVGAFSTKVPVPCAHWHVLILSPNGALGAMYFPTYCQITGCHANTLAMIPCSSFVPIRTSWGIRSSWVEQTPPVHILASGIGVLSINTWLHQISRVV